MATYDLCTATQVKTDLEITAATHDTLIASLISSASLAIMRRCQREFAGQTASATRDVRTQTRWIDLAPWDIRTVTSVTIDPAGDNTVLAATDYQLVAAPNGAGSYIAVELSRYVAMPTAVNKFGAYVVRIAGAWGAWTTATVPDDVRRACIITVGSWMDRAVAEYGADLGDPSVSGVQSAQTWAIPGAAWRLLSTHAREVLV